MLRKPGSASFLEHVVLRALYHNDALKGIELHVEDVVDDANDGGTNRLGHPAKNLGLQLEVTDIHREMAEAKSL